MSQPNIRTQNLDKVLCMTNTENMNLITERNGKIYRTPFRGETQVTKIERDDRLLIYDTHVDGSDGDGKIHEISYENILSPIIDPDNNPIFTERVEFDGTSNIPMEKGSIDPSDGDWLDYDYDNPYIRSAIFIPIEQNKEYKFYSTTGEILRIRVFLCDSSKKVILDKWNDGLINYKEFTINTNTFSTILDTARYLVFDVANNGNPESAININTKLNPNTEHIVFNKLYLPEYYTLDITDDLECTGKQLEINRDDTRIKLNKLTIKAPLQNPLDASIRLLNTGVKTNQFVDLKSVRDDENKSTQGRFEVGIRSYGVVTPVPRFVLGFADSINGPLIEKFIVEPDAKPIRLTKDGVEFRLNNYENNSPTKNELLTINFKTMYDKVEQTYNSLKVYNLLVDKIQGDTDIELININATEVDYTNADEPDFKNVSEVLDFLLANTNELNYTTIEKNVQEIQDTLTEHDTTIKYFSGAVIEKLNYYEDVCNNTLDRMDTCEKIVDNCVERLIDCEKEIADIHVKDTEQDLQMAKMQNDIDTKYLTITNEIARIDNTLKDIYSILNRKTYDLRENWINNDPIIDIALIVIESDTGLVKVGDGVHKYTELEYINAIQNSDMATTRVNDNAVRDNFGIPNI